MAKVSVTISVKKPWWSEIYIKSCIVFSRLFGVAPDEEKIASTIVKSCKFK